MVNGLARNPARLPPRHLEDPPQNIGQLSAPCPTGETASKQRSLRKVTQITDRYAPAFAIAMAVLGVPLALLYLMPRCWAGSRRRWIPAWISMPSTGRSPSPSWMVQAMRSAIAAPLSAEAADAGPDAKIPARRLHRHGRPALLFPATALTRWAWRAPCSWTCAPITSWRAAPPSASRPPRSSTTNQRRTMGRKLIELIDAAGLKSR